MASELVYYRSMKELQIYQIDSFAKQVFEGNPAAVVPLETWLDDAVLQKIALENNLSETVYFVRNEEGYHIRWFTPKHEVPLCGHGTLAAAFVIFSELEPQFGSIKFDSKSGVLNVKRDGEMILLDFPVFEMKPIANLPEALRECLNIQPKEVFKVDENSNYHVVLSSEAEVRAVKPDFNAMERLHPYGVVVTARGEKTDIVSRCFAPSYGIPEDPVTGSIHSALIPYWAKQLDKTVIQAYQASERGGDLFCELKGDRVQIGGYAVKYMEGKINL